MKLASAGRGVAAAVSAGVVIGAAGISAGLAAGGIGLAAIEMAGRSRQDIWSNDWAVAGLVGGGIGLLIAAGAVIAGVARIVTRGGPPGSGAMRAREDVIAGIVSVVAGVSADEVTPDKNFVEDFAVGSSCLTEIAVAVEDRFDIEIPETRLLEFKTVRDFADFVSNGS